MRIAFVNDSCERLGVEYISALLKAKGHHVRLFTDPQLFDDENLTIDFLSKKFAFQSELIAELTKYQPELVAFSVVTDFYQWACRIARMIKQQINVPIIFGGIHPTSVPELVIKNDFVDILCIGEGEYPMLELTDSMGKGQIDYSIKNLWFKKDGKIIKNEIRSLIQDLNVLPFTDKDLFYESAPHFSKCYFIMASRGCTNSCSYCCHSFLKDIYKNRGRYLRFRSPENVIAELKQAKKKYRINVIRFHDDDLMALTVNWLKEFAQSYSKEVNIPFACFVHPNTVTVEKVLLLKKAGCYDVEIGVQSISQDTRNHILNRYVDDQKLTDAINILKNAGLKIITDNIIGIPGQKREEIIDLLRFYNEHRVMKIYCFGFRYYPRTKIVEQARRENWLSSEEVEKLENGIGVEAFIRGGDTMDKENRKLQTFFTFLLYLPKKINKIIINHKIYRFFPPLPYFITVIFSNWLRIAYRYNWALHITISRYSYFVFKKIKGLLKSPRLKNFFSQRHSKTIQSVSVE